MALIRALLLPIKTRNEFLAQLKDDSKVLDGVKDDLWVLGKDHRINYIFPRFHFQFVNKNF